MAADGMVMARDSGDTWATLAVRRLARGVNLSHWYSQLYWGPGYVAAHFDAWVTDHDIALIADAGFDHVRLPIGLEHLHDPGFAERVDREIARLTAAGLAVILDAHPELPCKGALAAHADARDAFVEDWRRLAAAARHHDPRMVAFEILNEPGLGDPALWNALAARAFAAIRDVAPAHTLVVSGDGYSDAADLLELDLATVPGNAIVNWHLYEPTAITHQGAYFTEPDVRGISGLDYPLDPAGASSLLARADAGVRARVRDYVRAGWGPGTMRGVVGAAARFGAGRAMTCNELGVFHGAPRGARLRWLRDAREALESVGTGWTVWDYAHDFRIASGEPGARVLDVELLDALGLGGA